MAESIGDYAFLSDCQSAALISRHGSVDWLCFPRFDSPSVFARLLGSRAGHWSIRPLGDYEVERRYLADTLVLETTFRTAHGEAVLRDGLVFEKGSREHEIGISVPHVLARQVRGLSGRVALECEFTPCFEYGLTRPRVVPFPGGVRTAGGAVQLDLFASEILFECRENTAYSHFEIGAGDEVGFTLAYARAFPLRPVEKVPVDAGSMLGDTAEAWRSWSALHRGYQGRWQGLVRQSALVLQGLTYQPSGAVVAAATTSLPEVLGGDANWDYRFAWLRDLTLMLRALWVAACPDEPARFFHWIDRAGGRLGSDLVQIMYGVEGERRLVETVVEDLEGYAGSTPVRIGNAAWRQKQLDVLGEVLDGAYELREQLGELDDELRELLVSLADRAAEDWQEDDAGMWEARDEERPYLSSKVMCWVALDRAIKLAEQLQAGDRVNRWRRTRDEVRAAVLERGWCEQVGAYTGAFGSTHLDASVLLLPLVGFLPANDRRMKSTICAIERELAVDGLVRRWKGEENGFLITSFWLVECLALLGETEKAESRFEELLRYSNDLGLMAEMGEPGSAALIGNFPQAFSHVGLINAAWRLTEARLSEESAQPSPGMKEPEGLEGDSVQDAAKGEK